MKLHLGCGQNRIEGWVNIDADGPVDLQWDLRKSLPFDPDTVEAIYSEHLIEHLTRAEGVRLLSHCFQLLAPGGVMRVSTPDLRWLVAMYIAAGVRHWADVGWIEPTPCALLNNGLRLWGHQWAYDRPELVDVLTEAGFGSIEDAPWRESKFEFMRGLESRPYHREIILEAHKASPAYGIRVQLAPAP